MSTVRLPIKAKMIRHEDGSYSVDEAESEDEDVRAELVAGYLLPSWRNYERKRKDGENEDL